MKTKMFRCDCQTNDHHFLFTEDDEDKYIYLSSHLSPRPFFERITLAIKYIFGFRSRFGDYSEVILSENEWQELRKCLNEFDERLNGEVR